MAKPTLKKILLNQNDDKNNLTLNVKPGGSYLNSYNQAVIDMTTIEPKASFTSSTVTCGEQLAGGSKALGLTVRCGNKLTSDVEIMVKLGTLTYTYEVTSGSTNTYNYSVSVDDISKISVIITGKTDYGSYLEYIYKFNPTFEQNCVAPLTCVSDSNSIAFTVKNFTFPVQFKLGHTDPIVCESFYELQQYLQLKGFKVNLYSKG